MATQLDAQGQEWVDQALQEADSRAVVGQQQSALNDTIDYAWAATEARGDARPWDGDQEVALPPAAKKEVDNLHNEVGKVHRDVDEEQRQQFKNAAKARIGEIYNEAVPVNTPTLPDIDEEYQAKIIRDGGKRLQKDEATGNYQLVFDEDEQANNAKKMEADQQAKVEETKASYIKDRIGGETPVDPRKAKAEAEEIFGDGPVNAAQREVSNTVEMMPVALRQVAEPFIGKDASAAEFESMANITGGIRKYWNRRAGKWMLDPGDVAMADAKIRDMGVARDRYDAELKAQIRQDEIEQKRAWQRDDMEERRAWDEADQQEKRQWDLDDAAAESQRQVLEDQAKQEKARVDAYQKELAAHNKKRAAERSAYYEKYYGKRNTKAGEDYTAETANAAADKYMEFWDKGNPAPEPGIPRRVGVPPRGPGAPAGQSLPPSQGQPVAAPPQAAPPPLPPGAPAGSKWVGENLIELPDGRKIRPKGK